MGEWRFMWCLVMRVSGGSGGVKTYLRVWVALYLEKQLFLRVLLTSALRAMVKEY